MRIAALLSLTLFLGCSGNGREVKPEPTAVPTIGVEEPFDSTACPGQRVRRTTTGSGCRDDASGAYVEARCCQP